MKLKMWTGINGEKRKSDILMHLNAFLVLCYNFFSNSGFLEFQFITRRLGFHNISLFFPALSLPGMDSNRFVFYSLKLKVEENYDLFDHYSYLNSFTVETALIF